MNSSAYRIGQYLTENPGPQRRSVVMQRLGISRYGSAHAFDRAVALGLAVKTQTGWYVGTGVHIHRVS